jgi:hypothetical protein
MELLAKLDGEMDVREYKTPLQKLARRWKGSVQLWKDKYLEVKGTIKAFQNAAADARRSRDGWRQKAEQWKATAEQLQVELDRQRSEAAGESDVASLKTKRTIARI